jgi:hypothetical protein
MSHAVIGKRSYPVYDPQAKVSFSIQTCDPKQLPPFDETKRLTCPGNTRIKEVI